jgi:hypothetical protein
VVYWSTVATGAQRNVRSRQGLAEYLLLVGFLVLSAAGAVAVFGDELRTAFGLAPRPAAAAPARASAPSPPAR